MAKLSLDLSKVETESSSKTDFIPAGEYNLQVVDSEVNQNSKKTGFGMKIHYKVVDGPQAGKKVMDLLNIVNENAQAQMIALSRLKSIATLAGHKNPNRIDDSSELHGLHVRAVVTEDSFTNDKGQSINTNKIKSYSKCELEAGPSVSAPQAPAASKAKMPWEK